ncbi:DUF4192 domain-containing protein [Bifidobacterium simiiventris]|uniref:DUF4192 domain-containing protein n=1 Tax=Bifidobacterium simiiventris TaxID=2834434 RepID=UPI001C580606|nr:DUF4192 domain-containing protein [Bifidobacterium simiiventris]MBW3078822.1 DUF4192 family protein [Bifidobacterium simiiventris]
MTTTPTNGRTTGRGACRRSRQAGPPPRSTSRLTQRFIEGPPPSGPRRDPIEEPFADNELERLTCRFRDMRRTVGPREGNREWVRDPFAQWIRTLESARSFDAAATMLDREGMAAFAVGMTESLPIRDAAIVSLVIGRPCDERMMIEIASQPHSDRVRCGMSDMMTNAFHDARARPDTERCRRGTAMLKRMGDAVPERWRVQPLAALAYVLWWMGDDLAVIRALECLALDEDCTLAGIVVSLIERGIRPAWCGS